MNIRQIKTKVFKTGALYATVEYDGNIGHICIEGKGIDTRLVHTRIGMIEDIGKCKKLLSKITGKYNWKQIL